MKPRRPNKKAPPEAIVECGDKVWYPTNEDKDTIYLTPFIVNSICIDGNNIQYGLVMDRKIITHPSLEQCICGGWDSDVIINGNDEMQRILEGVIN